MSDGGGHILRHSLAKAMAYLPNLEGMAWIGTYKNRVICLNMDVNSNSCFLAYCLGRVSAKCGRMGDVRYVAMCLITGCKVVRLPHTTHFFLLRYSRISL